MSYGPPAHAPAAPPNRACFGPRIFYCPRPSPGERLRYNSIAVVHRTLLYWVFNKKRNRLNSIRIVPSKTIVIGPKTPGKVILGILRMYPRGYNFPRHLLAPRGYDFTGTPVRNLPSSVLHVTRRVFRKSPFGKRDKRFWKRKCFVVTYTIIYSCRSTQQLFVKAKTQLLKYFKSVGART